MYLRRPIQVSRVRPRRVPEEIQAAQQNTPGNHRPHPGALQGGRRAFPTMAKEQPIKIEIGSGNVFADLGLPDAEERLAKAQLADRICKAIDKRKLTQTAAAKIMGLSQPKVSDLT